MSTDKTGGSAPRERSQAERALDQVLDQFLTGEAPLVGLWLRASGVTRAMSTYLLQLGWPAFELALHADGLAGLPAGSVLRDAAGVQVVVADSGLLMDLTGTAQTADSLAFPVAVLYRGVA
ncbi:hypothetical protein [Actinomyces howellii]|uniref:Uncharacterized protein n=1 Tax=Actinomyces howellii TaxID=52771 RepID=A0A3S4SMT8_9ACTO|nr:hypothetical protein [Actinomyces howellii]VEG28028.1 Uncharacterised protein [Actinomyces howellii]